MDWINIERANGTTKSDCSGNHTSLRPNESEAVNHHHHHVMVFSQHVDSKLTHRVNRRQRRVGLKFEVQ